ITGLPTDLYGLIYSADGKLYGLSNSQQKMYTIDLATGTFQAASSPINEVNGSGVNGATVYRRREFLSLDLSIAQGGLNATVIAGSDSQLPGSSSLNGSQAITLKAVITGTADGLPAAGLITFYDNGAPIGQVYLNNGIAILRIAGLASNGIH